MPGYFTQAAALPVSRRQREILASLVRRRTRQHQHVQRARIILLGGEGTGNQQIADALHIDRKTVYHWRDRWLAHIDQLGQIEAETEADEALSRAIVSFLSDAPRSGTPVTYSAETVCQIIAVSCEDPSTCGYPISHWTPQTLRVEVIRRQIVSDISVRQIGRFLKGGRSQTPSSALLGTTARRSSR